MDYLIYFPDLIKTVTSPNPDDTQKSIHRKKGSDKQNHFKNLHKEAPKNRESTRNQFKGDSRKGNKMKLIDLIEKLRTEKGENGIWYVFRAWIIDMSNAKYTRNKDEYYEVIRGFLWGLEATDYITQEEKDQLLNELFEEYNKTNVFN